MSTMRSDNKFIAILCSDIHLSLKPPIWRSAESDWLEAQRRPLEEVKLLQEKYKCPILCAGDVFDKWNCSPELINYALKYLPDMYAIPGQHDLPFHKYDDLHRSAFWTLIEAGKIENITKDLINIASSELTLYGFPYGKKISPTSNRSEFLQTAIVHEYVWIAGHSYPKVTSDQNVGNLQPLKRGGKCYEYDVIVFGDNHNGFLTQIGTTIIFNCGTLMRRRSDEILYRPQVGLLLSTGKIVPHYLDISKDKHLDTIDSNTEEELDMSSFIEELEKLGDTALDFSEAIKEFMRRHKTNPKVKEVILRNMEKKI